MNDNAATSNISRRIIFLSEENRKGQELYAQKTAILYFGMKIQKQ